MSELAAIKTALDEIAARLDRLEITTRLKSEDHPSLNKFELIEELADEVFTAKGSEKACAFEPNGKPCDHCSMCNSRGF